MRQRLMSGGRLGWSRMAVGAAAGATAYYVWRSRLAERKRASEQSAPDPYLTASITINKPIEQVYAAWRGLESVGFLRGAQVTDARDQEMCAWTLPSGARGEVFFRRAPGARGTEVHVQLEQPLRHLGQSVIRAFGMAPDQQVLDDLRRFKQLLETGEVTRSDGPALWRAAQPAAGREHVAFTGGTS
jgi:uncharacterized membrane protein